VLLIVLLLSSTSFGQQNTIGISGGPSLCRLHGNSVFEQVDPIIGYQFGAGYSRWSKRGIGVQAQLTYARMGGALDYIGFNAIGEETNRDQVLYRFDHMGLSVGAGYRAPGRVHGQFYLGLMPTIVSAAEVSTPDTFLNPGTIVVTDLTRKVNSPVLFGYGAFGAGWHFKAPLTLGLLIRYDQGLTTLSDGDFFDAEGIIETSWSMSLSVSYRWPGVD